MALDLWQKLSNALPGKPFGDGSDGQKIDGSYSADNQTCTGTSGQKVLTLGASGFTNSNVVFIHQTLGNGSGQFFGQYEFNRIMSGAGTTSLTLLNNLQYTYFAGAQVLKVLMYTDWTINNGTTWTAPTWTGSKGGIMVVAARGIATIDGAVTAASKGYRLGTGYSGGDSGNIAGEGYKGTHGGGESTDSGGSANSANPGGGGGNGTAGTKGNNSGKIASTANLTTMAPGGGGGGGASGGGGGNGGNGGGIIVIFAKKLNVSGTITAIGSGGGGAPTGRAGGGGAGGSILLACQTATLGTNLVVASGGNGGSGNPTQDPNSVNGGIGGAGVIAINYNASYSGTTLPGINPYQDPLLTEAAGMMQII